MSDPSTMSDIINGRELVRMAFRHEATPRVPFAGVHRITKGYDAATLLQDGENNFVPVELIAFTSDGLRSSLICR